MPQVYLKGLSSIAYFYSNDTILDRLILHELYIPIVNKMLKKN